MKIRVFLIVVLCVFVSNVQAQKGFHFVDSTIKKQQISFKLINNLIVFPLEINGEELSFILDTGANKTILFDPSKKDSLHFANLSGAMLKGLGIGESLKSIVAKKNHFKIKNLQSLNETMYVTLNNLFDFSRKMGVTIHGIIGYNLFKDLIVKINYKSRKITFYNPKLFKYKKCKKCVVKPIYLRGNKPYIDAQIGLDSIGEKMIDVKLLIDSGGSDAMWLFENSKEDIKTPKRFFKDVLGEGISGHIYGKRSRLVKFKLGNYEIKNPTVSFLDANTVSVAKKFKARNGSLGGRLLNRFVVWFDYAGNRVTFKKNGSFTDNFNYNMSGLDVVYNGMELIKHKEFVNLGGEEVMIRHLLF